MQGVCGGGLKGRRGARRHKKTIDATGTKKGSAWDCRGGGARTVIDTHKRKLICHRPVHANAHRLAGCNAGLGEPNCMVSDDFLYNVHGASHFATLSPTGTLRHFVVVALSLLRAPPLFFFPLFLKQPKKGSTQHLLPSSSWPPIPYPFFQHEYLCFDFCTVWFVGKEPQLDARCASGLFGSDIWWLL